MCATQPANAVQPHKATPSLLRQNSRGKVNFTERLPLPVAPCPAGEAQVPEKFNPNTHATELRVACLNGTLESAAHASHIGLANLEDNFYTFILFFFK